MRENHQQRALTDSLRGFTIYDHPRDFPNHFVVRAWFVGPAFAGMVAHAPIGCLCDSLTEARATLPSGLVNLHRALSDDPVIVETWL